jgi:hypothetical protein
MITIAVAELNIGIKYRYEFTRSYVSDYQTDAAPDFIVEATDADMKAERDLAEEPVADEYLEYVAIYRKIADKLTEYDGAVFHGAVLDVEGKAYVITARSGVGKTTHVRLWLERFGDRVSVLNGDKPIIRVIDGGIYAAGTPWNGKEGYGKRGTLPLSGIAFLERSEENSYKKLTASEGLVRFMGQIYINKDNPTFLVKTLRLADKVLSDVPLYELRCNMDPSAADMAKNAFLSN